MLQASEACTSDADLKGTRWLVPNAEVKGWNIALASALGTAPKFLIVHVRTMSQLVHELGRVLTADCA